MGLRLMYRIWLRIQVCRRSIYDEGRAELKRIGLGSVAAMSAQLAGESREAG